MSRTYRNLLAAALCLCAIPGIGCSSQGLRSLKASCPLRRRFSDKVAGVRAPGERIATLRKMRQKAGWARPDEQQRISAELAAAYQGEEDPLIRVEIVRAIGRYATPAAGSVLHSALDDSDANVRQVACEAWGGRGGPEAAAELARVLSSDVDKDVRLAAAQALGEAGDRSQKPSSPKVWPLSPLSTNALECNQSVYHWETLVHFNRDRQDGQFSHVLFCCVIFYTRVWVCQN